MSEIFNFIDSNDGNSSFFFPTKHFQQVVESETEAAEGANPEHRAKGKQLGGIETYSPGY